jgi:hypothetical protein
MHTAIRVFKKVFVCRFVFMKGARHGYRNAESRDREFEDQGRGKAAAGMVKESISTFHCGL